MTDLKHCTIWCFSNPADATSFVARLFLQSFDLIRPFRDKVIKVYQAQRNEDISFSNCTR